MLRRRSDNSLASHAGVFRGARFSSLPTHVRRDEKRAPLKTPLWEANNSLALTVDFIHLQNDLLV